MTILRHIYLRLIKIYGIISLNIAKNCTGSEFMAKE